MKTIKHTFLVDDDAVNNLINTKVILQSKLAIKISSFTCAKEALSKLKQIGESAPDEFPQLIFLDINMPEMNGWAFLEEFMRFPNSLLQRCNVVMLTSSIDLFDIKRSKTHSIVIDYIIKPLNTKFLAILGSPKHEYFSACQSAVHDIR